MLKRAEIINILKEINLKNIEKDGPTSFFFTSKDGRNIRTFAATVQNEFITITTGKFFFKRKYTVNRSEL